MGNAAKLITEAANALALVREVSAIATAAMNALAASNADGVEPTDDQLAVLAAKRREALDRLAKLAG